MYTEFFQQRLAGKNMVSSNLNVFNNFTLFRHFKKGFDLLTRICHFIYIHIRNMLVKTKYAEVGTKNRHSQNSKT